MSETISIQIKTVLIKDFSISCSTTTRTGFWIFGKLRNFCAVLASRLSNIHICIELRLMYVFLFGTSLDIMWGILNKLTPPHDILTTSTNDILTTSTNDTLTTHITTNGKLTTLTPQANEEQTRAMIGQVSVDTRWDKNQMIIFWSSSELSFNEYLSLHFHDHDHHHYPWPSWPQQASLIVFQRIPPAGLLPTPSWSWWDDFVGRLWVRLHLHCHHLDHQHGLHYHFDRCHHHCH